MADIFGSKFVTAWKPDASPVTEADRAAEALIVPLLRDGWPGVPIISEELFAEGCVPPINDHFILVDPLDGTREFIAGRPEVTVNIAVVEEAGRWPVRLRTNPAPAGSGIGESRC